MLVDWFTVAAQVVNFLILVFLLKRFLYRPILEAMDEREGKIAAQLAEAAKIQAEAEAVRLANLQEYQTIEARREELLAQAQRDAEAQKQKLAHQVRQEIQDLRARWTDELAREQTLFFQDLRQRLLRQIAAIARRALRDLAGLELEQRLIEVFLDRLKNLDPKARTEFLECAQEAGGQIVITSGFELPREIQPPLIQSLRDQVGMDLTPRFEVSPEVISGIEVKAGGCKIAWSLENFLQDLEEKLSEAFAETGEKKPE